VTKPRPTTFVVVAPERAPFSAAAIEAIRRSRRHPRRTHHLYLHLRYLVDDLARALADVQAHDVLDVYCGARPYDDLLPGGARCVGLDIDDAYGRADVVSDRFLPFEDGSFDLVLCTQAFYFLPRPEEAVAEIARVLRPAGTVVMTLPIAYPGTERLYGDRQLRELFAGWSDLSIVVSGGTAVSRATLTGHLLRQVEKRLTGPGRPFRTLFPLCYWSVNAFGSLVDLVERRYLRDADRLPANLLIKATRPSSPGRRTPERA
jgi:SAM-dependent methyltransferase